MFGSCSFGYRNVIEEKPERYKYLDEAKSWISVCLLQVIKDEETRVIPTCSNAHILPIMIIEWNIQTRKT